MSTLSTALHELYIEINADDNKYTPWAITIDTTQIVWKNLTEIEIQEMNEVLEQEARNKAVQERISHIAQSVYKAIDGIWKNLQDKDRNQVMEILNTELEIFEPCNKDSQNQEYLDTAKNSLASFTKSKNMLAFFELLLKIFWIQVCFLRLTQGNIPLRYPERALLKIKVKKWILQS